MKTETLASIESTLISETKSHFEAAQNALRKGCEHALLAGLRLKWLHTEMGVRHGNNQHVSRETSTFEQACEKIGIPRQTAYRWINATEAACLRATLIFPGEDFAEAIPEPDTQTWATWDASLREMAQGISLNRLMLGAQYGKTEVARYDTLIYAEEEGSERAISLLNEVENGKYTLAQAIKALGSQEAYDKLRTEGGEKFRNDPVYLEYDAVEKKPVGLIPKAFTALENGFKNWATYDADARNAVRDKWLSMVKAMPVELTGALRS